MATFTATDGVDTGSAGGGAPADAKYLVQVADSTLSAEQAMGALGTGIVFNTTTTGVQSILTVGAGLTLTGSTLTGNLITGLAGGQTVIGGTAASENLTLSSTSNGTKGKVVVSDPMVLAAGTAANGAIQHPSNAGTGLYFTSSTQPVFTSNGAQVGSWTSTFFNFQVPLQIAGGLQMQASQTISGTTTGTGLKVGTAANQLVALWGVAGVVQPATTGTTTGFTANASANAVFNESTFTGGTGTKAYTISDIVLALKQAGIMAAS